MTRYAIGIVRTLVETRIIEAIDEEMAVNAVRNFGGFPKESREDTKIIAVRKLEDKTHDKRLKA